MGNRRLEKLYGTPGKHLTDDAKAQAVFAVQETI